MKIQSSHGYGGRWRLVLVDDRDEAISEVLLEDCRGDLGVASGAVRDELSLWKDEFPEMLNKADPPRGKR